MNNKKNQWGIFRGKPRSSQAIKHLTDTFVGLGAELWKTKDEVAAVMRDRGYSVHDGDWHYEIKKWNPRKDIKG
jgi:hypothetical protein